MVHLQVCPLLTLAIDDTGVVDLGLLVKVSERVTLYLVEEVF